MIVAAQAEQNPGYRIAILQGVMGVDLITLLIIILVVVALGGGVLVNPLFLLLLLIVLLLLSRGRF